MLTKSFLRAAGNKRLLMSRIMSFARFCDWGGGVGWWVAEGLGRSGVGQITLVDMDVIAESNINRQLPALSSTLGESKVLVVAQRLHDINPHVVVNAIDDFLTVDNVAKILPSREMANTLKAQGKKIVVLDCTDDMNTKIDPTKITVGDLKEVYQDPLLAKLRTKLREKGINRALKEKFGITCVYSTEPPKTVKACESGLHCGGYGSSVAMTW